MLLTTCAATDQIYRFLSQNISTFYMGYLHSITYKCLQRVIRFECFYLFCSIIHVRKLTQKTNTRKALVQSLEMFLCLHFGNQ